MRKTTVEHRWGFRKKEDGVIVLVAISIFRVVPGREGVIDVKREDAGDIFANEEEARREVEHLNGGGFHRILDRLLVERGLLDEEVLDIPVLNLEGGR